MGAPILWKSQLQTEIALSKTESEYIGLSYALRDTIPIMNMLQEMSNHGIEVNNNKPTVTCNGFEDNSGTLEMAKVHTFRPRTKHINVKLHHFRQYVEKGKIIINPIATDEQQADYLTKPVPESVLTRLRSRVMGW